ncbi:MAG: ATPase domain-containing protein [Candidatus Thermoplasmatota archaeon]
MELERDGLHRQFGGGIPKGAVMVLVGAFGSGKSAVCQRLLYGFLKNGHSATLISTEFTTRGFIEQMKSLEYNIVTYLLNRALLYIPVYPLIGKVRERGDFLGRLMESKVLYERDILLIDTFSSLVKHDIDMSRAIKALSLFKKLVAKNKTIILTIEEGELPPEILYPFQSDTEIYTTIKTRIIEGTTNRILHINRYTGSRYPVVELTGFRVEPKIGFIIDITTVA